MNPFKLIYVRNLFQGGILAWYDPILSQHGYLVAFTGMRVFLSGCVLLTWLLSIWYQYFYFWKRFMVRHLQYWLLVSLPRPIRMSCGYGALDMLPLPWSSLVLSIETPLMFPCLLRFIFWISTWPYQGYWKIGRIYFPIISLPCDRHTGWIGQRSCWTPVLIIFN